MTHPTRRAALAVERLEPRDVPASADLAVTITDLTVEMPDATVARYQIEVTNAGPDPVANVTITDDVGAGPPAANALYWTATASGGATVARPNGFGEFGLGATLPVGGRVSVLAAVQVQRRTSGPLVTTAAVTLGAGDTDPNPGDNTASDTTLVSGRSIPERGVGLFATGSDAGAPGDVRVYDVPSGQLLYQLVPFPGFGGGVRVATGDVTGDGRDDVIVGAGPGAGPHVKAYDGRDGREIASFFAFGADFAGGVFVTAALLDPPATGAYPALPFRHIVVGAGGPPHVRAFDPRDLSERLSFFAFDPGFTGGARVGAGNLDGTIGDELIVGAGLGSSHVRAFNRAGAVVSSFLALGPGFTGGVFVGAAGGEIVVAPGAGGGARVATFDTAGTERRAAVAFAGFPGAVRIATADRDGDGVEDLIVGAGPGGGPGVRALSGRDLSDLGAFFAYDPAFTGGVFVG